MIKNFVIFFLHLFTPCLQIGGRQAGSQKRRRGLVAGYGRKNGANHSANRLAGGSGQTKV